MTDWRCTPLLRSLPLTYPTCRSPALLARLAAVDGRTEAALLAELGPPLLQSLSEDAELWTANSSDLLTVLALLRCSGQWRGGRTGWRGVCRAMW